MRLRSALARALTEKHDVDTMFGLLGEANIMVVEDFVRSHSGRFLNSPREDAAILAALGYSHVTGRLGVATVSQGPGLTNAMTALTEGVRSRTPMLLVAGDVAVEDHHNLQNIEQHEVVRASGAGFVRVRSAVTGTQDLAEAVRRTFGERRPVVLNVPADLLDVEVEYDPGRRLGTVGQAWDANPTTLDEALGVMASAKRPLILAGWGAVLSGAREELLALGDRLGAPLATTLKAKNYFRGCEFDVGIFGTMSSDVGGAAIAEADCIVAFGAGLNPWTAARGALLDGKSVIHVDASEVNIGRWTQPTVGIVGDARAVASTMTTWLNDLGSAPSPFRSDELRRRLASYSPEDEFEDVSRRDAVDLRTFMIEMDRRLPRARNVVTDGGRFAMAPMRYLSVESPQNFIVSLSFGSIGLGLGTATGVACAAPQQPTVCVVGDGGFMMSMAEFNTAVRYGLDLIVLVMNDGSYGAEYYKLLEYGAKPDLSLFDWPELAPLADAMGGSGLTVRDLGDIDTVIEAVEKRDRPLLVDVKVDPADRIGFLD